ncbi:MAG: ATP-binding protein, partial [Opitutaceae bacterium]|nr:ATP-binding protein [Opitutaceae bacterium]
MQDPNPNHAFFETPSENGGGLSLEESILLIGEFVRKNQLSNGAQDEMYFPVALISKKLGMTKAQSLFFALMAYNADRNTGTGLKQLEALTGLNIIALLKFLPELEELVRKGYLRHEPRSSHRLPEYYIPEEVLRCIPLNKKPDSLISIENLSSEELFGHIRILFKEFLDYNTTPKDYFLQFLRTLFSANPNLPFSKKISVLLNDLSELDQILILYFCHRFVSHGEDTVSLYHLDNIFDKHFPFSLKRRQWQKGENPLILKKMVEPVNADSLRSTSEFKLTENFIKEYLPEFIIKKTDQSRTGIKYESIISKELFYNPGEAQKISELEKYLMQENFATIQRRLSEKGMRGGFSCIFHGGPGTGKTETAMQLARRTRRDIVQVNIAKTKSCWFGESEKQIQGVFDDYKEHCKDTSRPVPILLFNEADAIFGKRLEDSPHGIDQTRNSIQNIILQAMENLEGIMIATTNLTANLDRAFERRFLFKIYFEKPSDRARQAIWKTMLPPLSDDDAAKLARLYNFSGGEI